MSLSYFSLVYYKRNAVLNIARVVYWDRLGAVPSREILSYGMKKRIKA